MIKGRCFLLIESKVTVRVWAGGKDALLPKDHLGPNKQRDSEWERVDAR